MVRLRKEQGGSGIGPHWWPEEDPVCDVPEELARDLLAIPEWGYSREPDPEPEPEAPEGAAEPGEGEKPETAAKPPARRRRTT